MHSILSRFTPAGLDEFVKWIRAGAPGTLPPELLDNGSFAERLPGEIAMPPTQFSDRYELGVALVQLLDGQDQQTVSFDQGLWSWLAAFFFEQLCPRDDDGKRALRKDYVYTLSEPRIYYRHLVRTPWFLVKTHGERCRFLLVARSGDPAPLSRQSYLLDQLAARQFVISSPSLIGAAARLYSDQRWPTHTRRRRQGERIATTAGPDRKSAIADLRHPQHASGSTYEDLARGIWRALALISHKPSLSPSRIVEKA